MRTLTTAERNNTAARDKWVFAYMEVTDETGAWVNPGALADPTTGDDVDFFNSATLSDNKDANTVQMNAEFALVLEGISLSPFNSRSPANSNSSFLFAPLFDLSRLWRIKIAVMPFETFPDTSDYREVMTGVLDVIDIQEDSSGDGKLLVSGRGMEARMLDAYIATKKIYGDDTTPVAIETVLQQMMDDKLGAGFETLYTPVSPTFVMRKWEQDRANLMPAMATVADRAACNLRYKYDSADVNRFTLFKPNRTASVADWTTSAAEYLELSQVKIDLTDVRTYGKLTYMDAVAGITTIYSPAAEATTVSCTAGAATFSGDVSTSIADDAKIVVNEKEYTVSAFDGSTGCTLTPAETFSAEDWCTSAEITRYGLRILDIDLSADTQITDSTAAGNFIDGVIEDVKSPSMEQTAVFEGLWFAQLDDYVYFAPNGAQYTEGQYGAVVGYTMSFEDGTLITTINFSGKPKGRYATWLKLGNGAPRPLLVPEILNGSGAFIEWVSPMTVNTFGIRVLAEPNIYAKSAMWELSETADFAVVLDTIYSNFVDPYVPEFAGTQGHFFTVADAGRLKTYYVRITPYSGHLTGYDPMVTAGAPPPTGIAGKPYFVVVGTDALRPTKPQFDVLEGTVETIIDEPLTTHGDPTNLTDFRKWVDRPGATIDLSVDDEIGITVDPTDPDVAGTAVSILPVEIFECPSDIEQIFATIGAALYEPSTKLRRRANLAGAQTARIVGTITETDAPSGCELRIAIVSASGGTPSDFGVGLPLDVAGPVASDPFPVFSGAAVDAIVYVKTIGGNGTCLVAMSSLKVEVTIGITVVAPDPTDGGFSDPFDESGPLEAPWIPFSGPGNDVRTLNWAVDSSDGAGIVTLGMTTSGITIARGYYRADVPTESAWAIEQTADVTSASGGNNGIGVLLYELSSGKFLRFGVYDAVALQLRNESGTLVGSSVVVGDWGATQFRMRRNGADLEFWFERGSGWTLYGSFAIATYFDDPIAPTTHRYGFFNQTWTGDLVSLHGPWERTE